MDDTDSDLIREYAKGGAERERALPELFRRYEGWFRAIITTLLGRSGRGLQDVDDVLQDLYIRLQSASFQVPSGKCPVASWKSFTKPIIHHAAADHCTKRSRGERRHWMPLTGIEALKKQGMPEPFVTALEGIADRSFYSQKKILKTLEDCGTDQEREYWSRLVTAQLRSDQRKTLPPNLASDQTPFADAVIGNFNYRDIVAKLDEDDQAIVHLKLEGGMTFANIANALSMKQANVQTRYFRAIRFLGRDLNSG